MAPEIAPVDSIGVRRMWTIEVQSVQIGVVTSIVPPGSFVRLGAAGTVLVIVAIFRGKLHTTDRKLKLVSVYFSYV